MALGVWVAVGVTQGGGLGGEFGCGGGWVGVLGLGWVVWGVAGSGWSGVAGCVVSGWGRLLWVGVGCGGVGL